jgi:hypothetical protein
MLLLNLRPMKWYFLIDRMIGIALMTLSCPLNNLYIPIHAVNLRPMKWYFLIDRMIGIALMTLSCPLNNLYIPIHLHHYPLHSY